MSVEIRSARHNDLSDVERLLSAASLPAAGVADNIELFFVADREGHVVGSIGMEEYGDDVLLRSLTVADKDRSSGVGAALVRRLFDQARDAGKQRIFLMTQAASGYFERFGFRELERGSLPDDVRGSKEFSVCCAAGATEMMAALDAQADLKTDIRKKYAAVARSAQSSCCGGGAAPKTQVTRDLYSEEEAACMPTTSKDGSRGCGNPTAASRLREGDVVLDLGSGAGADVFLAAHKVGPTGKVYGLDMTKEMVDVARASQRQAGITNVEFMLGEMEHIPLPDDSVDVVISNCVISLVEDKDQVFREIARVVRSGGKITLSDIVSTADVPTNLRADLNAWLGCLGGALTIGLYREKLAAAGFRDISIETTRTYDLKSLLSKEIQDKGGCSDNALDAVDRWTGEICAASVSATAS